MSVIHGRQQNNALKIAKPLALVENIEMIMRVDI